MDRAGLEHSWKNTLIVLPPPSLLFASFCFLATIVSKHIHREQTKLLDSLYSVFPPIYHFNGCTSSPIQRFYLYSSLLRWLFFTIYKIILSTHTSFCLLQDTLFSSSSWKSHWFLCVPSKQHLSGLRTEVATARVKAAVGTFT